MHTNQKPFQCKRPRVKRAVLRERKDALCSPVNKVDRVEGRSWLQSEGPMISKPIAWSNAKNGFINEEDNFKLNPCRKRKPMELFCHESIEM